MDSKIQKTVMTSMNIDDFIKIIRNEIEKSFEKKQTFKTIPTSPTLISRNELLELFKITSPTLREWIKKGNIPKPIKKGRFHYFKLVEINESLKNK